jgi:hypothetical protein
VAEGVAVDASGAAYLGGYTRSTSYPTTTGVLQTGDPDTAPSPPAGSQPADGEDGFVAKLNPALNGATSLVWSTYFGGTDGDRINAIAVTPTGTPFVAGETRSGNMPAEASSPAPFSDTNSGDVDAFVAQISSDGEPFGVYTTYMGGSGVDRAYDVGIHQVTEGSFPSDVTYNAAYVVGETNSGSPDPFPTLNAAGPAGTAGNYNAFALKWTMGNVPRAAYSTYLGGALGSDGGLGLAVGTTGKAYIVGRSGSDFPVIAGGFQTSPTASAFAARIDAARPRILAGPSGPTNSSSATFSYDTGATPEQATNGFACSLDGAAATSCGTFTASKTYSSLGEGPHTFDVVLKDAAKMPSDPTRREFVVDTQPPAEFALAGPGPGETVATNRPVFAWQQPGDASTSIASYRLVVDDKEVRSVDSAACSDGTCSADPGADIATGAHTWRIDAVDQVGNVRASETRTFTVSTPPVPKLTINPNPALAGRTVTFDGSASADATHTISKYEWDLDGDGTFERDTAAAGTTTQSYATAKTINVSLRVTDTQGSSATVVQSLRISDPGAAGALLGVTINNGAQYTRSADVTVTAVSPPGTTQMIVSNDGGFLAGGTFPVQKDTKWKLDSSGPERLPKTIYVRFFTGPFPSETFQDDIILDETPPTVQQAQVAAPAGASAATDAIATASAKRKLSTWKLRIRAKDSNSGVARVQVTANKRKPGKLLRYKTRLTVKSATKPKWVRARDRAGNYSRWRKAR